ncbi:hypothetical protein C2S51_013735 [Perilla frutescens var. frutescens]|nr:hypothetical protein C2S51_013735 [Perilla frutescens var. frutescens]
MKTRNALVLFLISFAAYMAVIVMKQHSTLGNRIYDVRIINGFTNNSSLPLVVWCVAADGENIGGRALQERDDYSWSVEVGLLIRSSTRFVCTLKWDAMRKKFEAFRATRDRYRCGATAQCLWLVKEDGFYFSNNGVHWIKDFPWLS